MKKAQLLLSYIGILIAGFVPVYLIRFSVFGIPTTLLEMCIYCWFGLTVLYAIHQKKVLSWFSACQSRLVYLYAGFVAIAFGLIFIAENVYLAAGAWKGWMLDPFIFFITALYYYHDVTHARRLVYGLVAGGVGTAIFALYELGSGTGMQIPGYANAFFSSANYLALYLVPIWLMAIGLTLESWYTKKISTPWCGILHFALHLVLLVVVLATRSYAGILASAVGGLVILSTVPKDFVMRKYIFGGAIIVVLLMSVFVVSGDKLQRFFDTSSYNSFQTRAQIWTVSMNLIAESPVLGVGFGNFEPRYYDRAFELYHPPYEWEVPRAHNLFLHTWVETGLIGLIMLILLLYRMIHVNVRALHNLEIRIFAGGVLAALIASIIHGLLDTPYYKNDLSVVFVIILIQVLLFEKVYSSKKVR